MPSVISNWGSEPVRLQASARSPYDPPRHVSQDDPPIKSPTVMESAANLQVNGCPTEVSRSGKTTASQQQQHQQQQRGAGGSNFTTVSLNSLPNGRSSGSSFSSSSVGGQAESRQPSHPGAKPQMDSVDASLANGRLSAAPKAKVQESPTTTTTATTMMTATTGHDPSAPTKSPPSTPLATTRHRRAQSASNPSSPLAASTMQADSLRPSLTQTGGQRMSQASQDAPPLSPLDQRASGSIRRPDSLRLSHRHTLQVPKAQNPRGSRDFSFSQGNASEDAITAAPPLHSSARRASLNLVRRNTRSIQSDIYLEEIPQDADATKYAEAVLRQRASRKKRREELEDDKVMVGTKVDQNHVNWVIAYNMLTGIRFTVSRTNAKIDRELTDQDFDAKHKFSFDITGNELTPSARYDFKFKDYAPWVFRHLRAKFHIDPADYLISLTSKYILSELGSPGKSGSFFYFSRDYKYIIKTIHHAEHKLLRKILRDYYHHIEENPNTLISQFYGLHRVKIPYGRKIHFVVMNNLFPPHRDIHQTFDLKGSTIGRNFKEEDLGKNPRATLKDLNWLRRNYHLEFGPRKKQLFVEQMQRDVALLQRLKIMDYSLLVGIHDLGKGNEENLRDKTLQVFQPGGGGGGGDVGAGEDPATAPELLARTPSKLENARKARELRQMIKREKPVPMEKSTFQMPEEELEAKKHFIFYSDDGGFRATHEDGRPGEEIYYLGIIDCLTHYGFVKRLENFWKGMSNNKQLISPVPPVPYGERFVNFITGTTMPREEAEVRRLLGAPGSGADKGEGTTTTLGTAAASAVATAFLDTDGAPNDASAAASAAAAAAAMAAEIVPKSNRPQSPAEKVLDRAERQAQKTDPGEESQHIPGATLSTSTEFVNRGGGGGGGGAGGGAAVTLPVVEEVGEGGSTGGRSAHSRERERSEASSARADSGPPSSPPPPLPQQPSAALPPPVARNNKQRSELTMGGDENRARSGRNSGIVTVGAGWNDEGMGAARNSMSSADDGRKNNSNSNNGNNNNSMSPPLGGRPPPTPPKDPPPAVPRDNPAPRLPIPSFINSPTTFSPTGLFSALSDSDP